MSMDARDLVLPEDWTRVTIPEIDTELLDGTQVLVPEHEIEVAHRYPTLKGGSLVANVTQAQAAEFLRTYNQAFDLKGRSKLRYPTLFEDEAMRDQLGSDHVIFDENFGRNEMPYRWGYVADFTGPYGNGAEGVNQKLVTRMLYWRLPDGEVQVGPITIAPSGMVPNVDEEKMKQLIGHEGLKKLRKLTRRNDTNVRNALGYPQLTFSHDQIDEEKYLAHGRHFYTPSQSANETVAVRGIDGHHPGDVGCFDVSLDIVPSYSYSDGSFPLVRGEPVEAGIKRNREYVM